MRSIRGWLIFLALMLVLPFFVPAGILRFLAFANFVAIWAMSWDILSGYTGYVSFGHPFLIGLSGYVSAMLTYHLGFPLYGSMALGVLAGTGAGLAFFFPALRARGPYFSLVTLALMDLTYHLVIAIRPDITGGTRGLTGLPVIVSGAVDSFRFSFGVMFSIAIGLWYIARSDIGTMLSAIHMDEDVVESEGFNTVRLKMIGFLFSAVVASIGGVLYAHYLGSVSPKSMFGTDMLFIIVVAALIGGEHSIIGGIIGAYFIIILLQLTRPFFPGEERWVLYAAIALLIYLLRPGGLYRIGMDIGNWVRRKVKGSKQYGQVT